MATYGITATGFVRKPLSVIKSDLEANCIAQFGADTDVSSNSVFGKEIGVISQEINSVWELMEDVYNSFSPDTADGTSLDNAVALTAIARKAATASTVWTILRLQPATTVPSLSRVGILGSDPAVIYTLNAAVSDTVAATTYGAWVTIGALAVGDTYDVLINGTNHTSAAAIGSDTKLDILADIVNEINVVVASEPVTAYLDIATETLYVYGDPVGTAIPAATFSVSTAVVGGGGGTMAIPGLGSIGYFTASETGAQPTLANTLTDILDGVVGWDGVENIVDADIGEALESDADLRIRREQSLHVANGGPVEAIRAALLNLADVDSAIVLQNITDLIDAFGAPPHTISAIVDIVDTLANDQLIAKTLFANVAGGMATHGNDSYTLRDSQDIEHVIKFSRPESIGMLMRVTYRVYDEEVFPDDGETQIQTIVVAWASANQDIGLDMIPTRYIGPIYSGVSGIDQLSIEIDYVGPPPATQPAPVGWTSTPLDIDWDQRAALIATNVSFVLTPP